jgi:hypothetical protein
MNNIQKRLKWESYDDIRPMLRPGGRTGTGARNHCAHGKNVVLETILDWQPFEYYTTDYPMGSRTQYLERLPEGTRVNVYFKLKTPLPGFLKRFMAWVMSKLVKEEQQFDTLVRLITEEATQEQ